MTRLCALSIALLALAASSCDHVVPGCGSIDGRAGTCAVGEMCASSLDCTSSNCDGGVCATSCTRASECASGEICVSVVDGAGTRRYCSSTCPAGDWHVVGDTGGLVCIAGVLTHCSDLSDPGPVCDVCRCSAGQQCLDPDGVDCRLATTPCTCLAPAPVGSPCISNVGCISFNCSGDDTSPARHCQVAATTPCTPPPDCVLCDEPDASGMPTCRQSCARDADCGSHGLCLTIMQDEPACYVDCSFEPSCPPGDTCMSVPGDDHGRRYCAPA